MPLSPTPLRRRWLREMLQLLAVALLPPPRRLDTLFDRIERMP